MKKTEAVPIYPELIHLNYRVNFSYIYDEGYLNNILSQKLTCSEEYLSISGFITLLSNFQFELESSSNVNNLKKILNEFRELIRKDYNFSIEKGYKTMTNLIKEFIENNCDLEVFSKLKSELNSKLDITEKGKGRSRATSLDWKAICDMRYNQQSQKNSHKRSKSMDDRDKFTEGDIKEIVATFKISNS